MTKHHAPPATPPAAEPQPQPGPELPPWLHAMFQKASAVLDAVAQDVLDRVRRRGGVDVAGVWLDLAIAHIRAGFSPGEAAQRADELLKLFLSRSKRFVVKSRYFARKTKAAEDALDGAVDA